MEPNEYIYIFIIFILCTLITLLPIVIVSIPLLKKRKESLKNEIEIEKLHFAEIKKYTDMIKNETFLKKAKRRYNIITTIIILLLLLITISLLITFYYFQDIYSLVFLIIIGIGYLIINPLNKIVSSLKKDYTNYFKENIIRKILKENYPNYIYNSTLGIDEADYLFESPTKYNKYTSESKIEGIIENYKFSSSNVKIQVRDYESRRKDAYVTKYYGPVSIVELNQSFDINISILKKDTSLRKEKYTIDIDNPIFEEIYTVYANNQILAVRTLSPKLTTTIIDLYNKYKIFFEIKIVNKKISIKFYTKNLFEPNIKSPKKEAINIIDNFITINKIQEIIKEIIKSNEFLRDINI